MPHYNLTITGRVQGVGFRASTRNKAMQLGINGYVKNLPNRAVYIEAEGTEQDLGDFIAWCRKGPTMAFVDDVKIEEGAIQDYKEFSIKYR